MSEAQDSMELVKAARALTGKPARPSDQEVAAWLDQQEVTSKEDLLALSEASFSAFQQAPGMSLVLLDGFRRMRAKTSATSACQPDSPLNKPREAFAKQVSAESADVELVELVIHGHIGTIMLCNDTKRNALNHKVCNQICSALGRSRAAGVRAIILRAKPGTKVWSAGHDIRDFKRIDGSRADSGSLPFQEPLSRGDAFVQLLDEMRNTSVPVLGCIEGSVWGAATDICACCDVLVGTPSVTFAITPAKIGLPYNSSGMAHFIQVLPLHVVKWMFFSSTPISADKALQYGLLNAVVPSEDLTAKAEEMAAIMASRAPMVVELLKKQCLSICSSPALTPDAFEELHEMRKRAWCSEDMQEGVRAFFEKRQASFSGR